MTPQIEANNQQGLAATLDIDATKDVLHRLREFDNETRLRILRAVLTFYGLDAPTGPRMGISGSNPSGLSQLHDLQHGAREPSFGDRTELPPKQFLFQKQPQTDVDRIACLAYYLTHYRDTPHFKTVDLSKLNTEAAQSKFSNTAYAVVNAVNAGLLASAGSGAKQLSAAGERYVEALPDRGAAREILASIRARRRRKATKNHQHSENY